MEFFSDSAEIDDKLGAINGTLLPAMDKNGNYFGVMNDFFGHGTASSATIASKGKLNMIYTMIPKNLRY